jgi:hypothetical protein
MRLITVYHADHGVSLEMLEWAFPQFVDDGVVACTFELPEMFGTLWCGLNGPAMGDAAISRSFVEMIVRNPERGGVNPPAPILKGFALREDRRLTIVGMKQGKDFTLYTAYAGPLAPRLPGDSSMTTDAEKAEAEAYWSTHALSDIPAPLNVERYREIMNVIVGGVVDIPLSAKEEQEIDREATAAEHNANTQ